MDRRRFLVLALESPLLPFATSCATKESSPFEKFEETFDNVFKDLETRQETKVSQRPKYIAQVLRWSDGTNRGVDVLFKGVRPSETFAISNYLNKPWEVFIEDNSARTVVFGSGTQGKFALYSVGNKHVRSFAEGAGADVPADKIDQLLAELKSHHKNRRSR